LKDYFIISARAPYTPLANNNTYSEEGHGTSTLKGAVGYVRLLGQVGSILDRRDHPLDGEEGGEVGGVGGDYN
jgi:hypothetical protein